MHTRELAVCIVEYNVYTSIATAVGILDAFDLFDANGSDAFGADDLFSRKENVWCSAYSFP